MSQISLQNLKKSFGKTKVIHDLSIDVKDGELIVIVGPSGCGKSTLLRMVAGLEDANEGNILIDNNASFQEMLNVMKSLSHQVKADKNSADLIHSLDAKGCGHSIAEYSAEVMLLFFRSKNGA